ncbi:MAG: hypothetical protein AAFZ65_04740 [Planctomycetota bacterium]
MSQLQNDLPWAPLVAAALAALAPTATAQAPDETGPAPESASQGPYDDLGFELHRWSDSAWFGRMTEPVTQPYLFESPFVHTSAQFVYIRHNFPISNDLGVPNLRAVVGKSLDVYALQARFALTERLAIIATKDGVLTGDPDGGADSRDGYADIAGGFKYALIDDPEAGYILTGGATLEFTQGSTDVFQGNGDGILRPFVSAGKDYGKFNLIGALGLAIPFDDDANSTVLDWHVNLSYDATENLKPFFETNCLTYLSGGDASSFGLTGIEGVDVGNLGSEDVAGNDVITGAAGLRYELGKHFAVGGAYEFPYLTSRDDLNQERWTFHVTAYL